MPRPPMNELFVGTRNQLLRWPDARKGPFVFEADWAKADGRVVCVGLHVWKGVEPQHDRSEFKRIPGAPQDGLGGTDLRFGLGAVIEALWGQQQELEEQMNVGFEAARDEESDPEACDMLDSIVRSGNEFAGRRPKRVDELYLRRVADVYRQAMSKPGPKRPTTAVQHAFGLGYSTATKDVRRAREHGFLSKTTSGRPSVPTSTERKKGQR